MTAYSVAGPTSTYTPGSTQVWTDTFQLSVSAVSFPVRIIKIERMCIGRWGSGGKPGGQPYSLSEYIGAAVSGGGGTATPSPARGNAAPATATCKYATATDSLSSGGIPTFTSSSAIAFTGGTHNVFRAEDNPTLVTSFASVEMDYQFPVDLIINPGSTFLVSGTAVNGVSPTSGVGYLGFTTSVIYFEEEHLARSA